jgi:hypothetical protein
VGQSPRRYHPLTGQLGCRAVRLHPSAVPSGWSVSDRPRPTAETAPTALYDNDDADSRCDPEHADQDGSPQRVHQCGWRRGRELGASHARRRRQRHTRSPLAINVGIGVNPARMDEVLGPNFEGKAATPVPCRRVDPSVSGVTRAYLVDFEPIHARCPEKLPLIGVVHERAHENHVEWVLIRRTTQACSDQPWGHQSNRYEGSDQPKGHERTAGASSPSS